MLRNSIEQFASGVHYKPFNNSLSNHRVMSAIFCRHLEVCSDAAGNVSSQSHITCHCRSEARSSVFKTPRYYKRHALTIYPSVTSKALDLRSIGCGFNSRLHKAA